jgi:hypothetical protein
MNTQRDIIQVVRKGKIKEQGNDFLFWQSQSYLKRLTIIEEIRQSYNQWKYGTEQGLQRVYRILNENKVRYLVVGGYIVGFHGYPRYTKDLDIWIWINDENAENLLLSLK